MEAFAKAGGRLFRITLLFMIIALVTMGIMAYFTARAMKDVKEIALTGGENFANVQVFYTQLIGNLKLGTVIASLSGVIIAVAARYGLRETAKNLGEGGLVPRPKQPTEDSLLPREGSGK